MSNLPDLATSAANEQLRDYYEQLDALAQDALAGRVREDDFREEAEALILAALLALFLLGRRRAVVGIPPAVEEAMAIHRQRIAVLANDIYSGRYSRQEVEGRVIRTTERGREMLSTRMSLWALAAATLYAEGQVQAPPAVRVVDGQRTAVQDNLRWDLGATEQHCATCLELNGTVLSRAEWARIPHRPQGKTLACGGWRCDCTLTPTDEPSMGLDTVSPDALSGEFAQWVRGTR